MTLTLDPGPVAAPQPGAGPPAGAGRRQLVAHRVRRAGWPLAIGALLVLAVGLTFLVSGQGNSVALDPDGAGPDGARALAQVLDSHGHSVQVVRSPAELDQANRQNSAAAVLVSQTDRLSAADVGALSHLRPGVGGLVLVAPDQRQLDVLAPGVRELGVAPDRVADPGCSAPSAVTAGRADAGGFTYAVDGGAAADECYDVGGHPSYIVQTGNRPTVVIGQARLITNDRLAKEGNAALAIGALGASDRVIWFVPSGADAAGGTSSLSSLLPRWVGWVVLELFVVVAVSMVWRGRRLGRLVPEPLPVVVRAVETTEGRARMYRRSRAHGRAAATLRAATLARLRDRTGLPRGAPPEAVVAVVAARTGIPGTDVAAMLTGPPPTDDAGLVRLAQVLDQLDREVRRP